MASYQIEWKSSARKELRKLPKDKVQKIVEAVDSLATNPRPTGCRKLVGSEQTWRIRVGSYRVIYNIFSSILVIEVVRVAHRKNVYRNR
ncbi:type II toxin-antitoxin system RelE family toxin [Candidatus Leptofilum sp.]|uniref:type II toxin-antitoxin system RelE family toxin n=1 Tax=Candidatus Leptofilum sp. TaxID=3241576 RepID=UPI003B5AC138